MQERPGEDLKLYGEWIEELNAILHINKAELARRAEVKQNTLSENMRKSRPRDPEDVHRIWKVYATLAIEQQKFDLLEKREAFLNAADVVTEKQKQTSRDELASLEQRYPREQVRRIRKK